MEKFIVICLSLRNFNRSYENQIDQFHLYFLYKKKKIENHISLKNFSKLIGSAPITTTLKDGLK